LESTPPIRTRATEEGNFQIPLWGVPFILLLLYVCLFSGLGALGLVGPDEPRYAAIARAMSETHDWITPRLWGTPWFEKPVLYYWTAGIAMRLFGVSEFAARLPSALAALLAVVAVAWTALRIYGIGAAWYTLLMLPTSVAMIGFARAASPDMLFAGLLTATMAVAVEMLQKPRPGSILRVAFGFFLGAAVLAKGPAAVILAGGATILWAVLARQWRAPFRFLHPLVIAVFCATALPWYVLCAIRNSDFLQVFIWQHNFERYLTPIFEHRQPFWFFGPIFLLGILPWLPLLITSLWDASRIFHFENERDSPAFFIACWGAFTLLFFSISQSKLPGYILPAFPPAALLLARSFVRQSEQQFKGVRAAIVAAAISFPVLIGIVLAKRDSIFGLLFRFDRDPLRGFAGAFSLALVGGGLAVALAIYRKWSGAISMLACTTLILLFLANQLILPSLDEIISARPVAREFLKVYPTERDRAAVFQLPRSYEYGLDYYFREALPQWTPEKTGARFIFSGKPGLEQLLAFPELNDVSKNKSYIPLDPGNRVFLIDLGLKKAPSE
jgi:4-amino-4-deoxy-L-arabinose transferase-like glycosyltransferase